MHIILIRYLSLHLFKTGKHFDGIWHTGVVAYGKEWYFGNDGIDCCEPVSFNLSKNYLILRI